MTERNVESPDDFADVLDLRQSEEAFEEEEKFVVPPFGNLETGEYEERSDCPGGILDDVTIKKCLSNLGKTPDGLTYAMLDVKLMGKSLINADALQSYPRLQNIDLSHNKITDIGFLQNMENIISITATNNQITDIFNKPMKNYQYLREIDFSFNQVRCIQDLSIFNFLSKVNLHGNDLTDVEAFADCTRLIHLNVAHNKINSIEPLRRCPLQYLNVSYNNLSSLTGLETISRLQELIASGNKIKSLEIFNECHVALFKVDLENNKLIDIDDLRPLQMLNLLREVNLRHNPIVEVSEYRLYILFLIQKLTHLDGNRVEIEEKVKAVNTFSPSLEIIAARDHRINCVNRFFKAQTVLYSTLQNSYTPYPMLVLVGPKGSGKKWLSRKLVQNFPNFFGLAISHTDQPSSLRYNSISESDKELGEDYQHVTKEEFDSLRIKGHFLETCKVEDYQYGLSVDVVEAIAREGLACVIDMELEGVMSLKMTHFEPRYVLTMPLNRVVQESRIRFKAITPVGLDDSVKQATKRIEMYLEINRCRPGFFDKFICTDDLDEAYVNLKRLVMDYLGLTSEEVTESRTVDANSRLASTGNLTQSRATISQPKASSQSHRSLSNRGIMIENESLQRRLNTAKAAINRRGKDEYLFGYKPVQQKKQTSDTGVDNSDDEDDISSEMSNQPTEFSDLGYKSPNPESPVTDNELNEFVQNTRDEMEPLEFSNQSSSSVRSLTAKAPREVVAN